MGTAASNEGMRARIDGGSGDGRNENVTDVRPASLVRQYAGQVYVLLLRVTRDATLAADLARQTLVCAAGALSQVEGECGTRMWLHAIAVRLALEAFRDGRIQSAEYVPEEYLCAVTDALHDPPRAAERRVAELPFEDRLVTVLCVIESYSREETAMMLGTTVENVVARLGRFTSFDDGAGGLLREMPRDGVAPTEVERPARDMVGRLRSLFRSR